jgi:signal transduction histidine kinase
LTVSYRPDGDLDKLDPLAFEAAYRVIQESLTNALKHAPGAPIDISLRATNHHVDIEVTSAATRDGPSGLERTGGGHGLSGMRHRVTACGGTLTAGPTAAGGWRVAARLPEQNHHPIDAAPTPGDGVTT